MDTVMYNHYHYNISEEIRLWTLVILAIIGAFITIRTFILSNKQRKLENTYRTLDFLRDNISKEQIDDFIKFWHANIANREWGGLKEYEFKFEGDDVICHIDNMFSDGGFGRGNIENLIALFDLMCPSFKKTELSIIWYEYGQIMETLYVWTGYLKNKSENPFDFCSQFNKFMKKYSVNNFSSKTIVYVE